LGFFDSIDNDDVATALFDRVRMWAVDRRLDAVVGPFNLDRENGYGVLVEGRDRSPVLMCGHTPPYYASFFDRYGFVPLRGDNLAYAVELAETPALRRLSRLADRIRARGRLTVRAADLERWDEEVDRVYGLLQRALAHLPDYVPWRRSEVQELLQPFVKFVDPELVLFAEADGQTVGWFPGIPNLYEVLQHANGLRYPWDYVRLWWHSRTQPECLSIKSVLVLPEYWNTGVSVLLFDEMVQRARAKGFVWLDLSLTSEDNPYTPTLATRLGATLYKRYRVYRLDLTG
jgi:GNAT superfamily N-acetyltransferase